MTNIMQGYQFVQQGYADGRKNRLASLLGQAYTAPQDQRQGLLGQAAQIDPVAAGQYGQQLQGQDDQGLERVAKAAMFLAKAPEHARPKLYAQMLPSLRQAPALASVLPDAYDAQVDGVVQQFGQIYGGVAQDVPSGYKEFDMLAKDGKLSPEDRALAARRALYLDPRPSNAAIQYKEVRGADGRTYLVGLDPREVGAETIGGGPTYGSMGGDASAQTSSMDVAGMLQRFGGTITSGYRDPATNARVDGVPNSQHMTGDAFDVVMPPHLKASAIEYGKRSGFEVIDEGDHLHFERPSRAPSGPNKFASRTPEEDAAAIERAKIGAQIDLAPQVADAEADRAGKVVSAQEQAKLDVEKRKNEPKLRMALMSAKAKTARLDDAISKAAQQAGVLTTGWGGALTKAIPGTPAYDLSKTLTTIQANIGFDRLQEMRDSSPTGGALGSVTERELEFLQSVYASLEQSQSQEQFLDNLEIVRQATKESWDRVGEAYRQTYGQSQGAAQQPQAPTNGGWSIQKVE